jgi:hypothetical protein
VYCFPKTPAGEQRGGGGKRDYEVAISPLEFIARVAALIPSPRQHRHRYYEILAPHALNRRQVTPKVTASAIKPEVSQKQTRRTEGQLTQTIKVANPARQRWAKLIARVYEVEPLRCVRCRGLMKIIAFITERSEIKAILKLLPQIADVNKGRCRAANYNRDRLGLITSVI